MYVPSNDSGLTEHQVFRKEHLRACGKGSLKAYAKVQGMELEAMYAMKATLCRALLASAAPLR